MDELITQVCTQLGLNEAVTRKALGEVLKFLKENVPQDFDFSKILNIPGAETLIDKADEPLPKDAVPAAGEGESTTTTTTTTPKADSSASTTITGFVISFIKYILTAGPIFDILKKILSTFFGENAVKLLDSASDSAQLVDQLHNLGISKEQATTMVNMMISFMKNKVGADVVDQLVDSIPALKAVVGSSKKEE